MSAQPAARQSRAAASLNSFFHPRTVAVVGASREADGIGHRILLALLGNRFSGAIFPVNPHASEVAGLKAFPSLTAVPGPVDLAVIAVPPDVVLAVIDACAAKQIQAVVLITAGFA
ncbi:MAG: CoA-binding protein, partial [Nitrospirota bacterium]